MWRKNLASHCEHSRHQRPRGALRMNRPSVGEGEQLSQSAPFSGVLGNPDPGGPLAGPQEVKRACNRHPSCVIKCHQS